MPSEAERPRSGRVPPEWLSATVIEVATGAVLLSQSGDVARSTASVPKLLLLAEFAERIVADPGAGSVLLRTSSVGPVADSGLWQHLRTEELPAEDVAFLIGALSDNLATNVLLAHIGLEAVTQRAETLGLGTTRMHDFIRDQRGPQDPERTSTGTTDELARLMVILGRDGDAAGGRVLEWISHGVDLSMVAHAFGLDPLSHGCAIDRGFEVWSKTGTSSGVRADVGLIRRDGVALAYAAVANWIPTDSDDERDGVLEAMHRLGDSLRSRLEGDRPDRPITFG